MGAVLKWVIFRKEVNSGYSYFTINDINLVFIVGLRGIIKLHSALDIEKVPDRGHLGNMGLHE